MDESTKSAWKAIGMAAVAPAIVYLLIFHHWRVETDAECMTVTVLSMAGFGAAIKWA